MVSTARPRKARPAKGLFLDLERKSEGSQRQPTSGSITVTSAALPGESWPPGRPRTRAGREVKSATSALGDSNPRRTRSSDSGNAVSSPSMPKAAFSNSTSFSTDEWGAWSVAMASTVPSASASHSASMSAMVRRGGLHLVKVSYSAQAWSVSVKWCGVTSQVTGRPRRLASRTRRTDSAVLRWATW